MTSVSIPNSVTSIGDAAFRWTGLTSVSIPNSVIKIESDTFYGCESLISVSIPSSVIKIESKAFYGCKSLRSVAIPSSVTSIGQYAFKDCSNLKELTFESSPSILTFEFRDNIFEDCDSITNLSIGRQLQYEENSVYYRVSYAIPIDQITYLTILDGVNFKNFFYYYNSEHRNNNNELADKLTTLKLGKNITGFGLQNYQYGWGNLVSLSDYSKLETIICEDPIPTPDCPKFSASQYTNIKVYVPKGSLAAYQNAEGWKNFWDIIEMEESGIDSVTNDLERTEVGRYDFQGRKVADDYNGIVIVKYSDGTAKKIINRNGNAE